MQKIKTIFSKIKLFFSDHFRILFKSAADNHLRIQHCGQNADGSYQCNIKFGSYSELKKYQKKIRRITVSLSSAVAMVIVAFMVAPYVMNPNKSGAASYAWSQSSWATHASDPDSATTTDKTAWAQYQTKDAAISAAATVALAPTAGSVTQSDDGTTSTGFNLAGNSNSSTAVSGTGSGASVKLTGTSVPVNAWDTALKPVPGAVNDGGNAIRNGADDVMYVTQGNNGTGFYKYSISTNTWTTLTAAPGGIGTGSSMIRNGSEDTIFVIRGGYTNGFYKYSISTNTWTTLANVSGVVNTGSAMIRNGSDDTIYALQGGGYGFYTYSISTNTWTTQAPSPSIISSGSMIRNGTDNDIYVTQGNGNASFYKYSISGNSWTTLTAAPGSLSAGSVIIRNGSDDAVYVTQGGASSSFYQYSISTNTWTTLTVAPSIIRYGANMIRNGSDDSIYVTQGNTNTGFYKYSISANNWTTLSVVPGALKGGSSMIRNGSSNDIYVTQGNGANGFYKYSIADNSWVGSSTSSLASVPGSVSSGSSMIRNGADDAIYVTQGASGVGFYKYSISGNSWTTLAVVPVAVSDGSSMIRNGSDNDIYLLPGNGSNGFYRYSISGNSWTTLTATPAGINYGSSMIRNGSDNDIYVTSSAATGFYKYSISGNSWTTLTAVPATVGAGSSMIRNGSDDDIYVTSANASAGFYKYSISGNSWTTLTVIPAVVSPGSHMIRNGSDNDIYVVQGYGSAGFYKYSIPGNSWTTLATLPNGISIGSSMIRNGVDNDIYVTQGGGNAGYYKYSISGNSWTTLTAVPAGVGYGGSIIRNGSDNDIYVMPGNGGRGFYRYIINQTSYSSSGTYTSGVIDTGQKNAAWGNVSWNSTLNGQTVSIKARTGNQPDLSDAPAFSGITNSTSAGNMWSASAMATYGSSLGQVNGPQSVALDSVGNLYVAEYGNNRIQMRTPGGVWSALATAGSSLGQVGHPYGVAVDSSGNLYVADSDNNRIQMRTPTGTWSVLATSGSAIGQVSNPRVVVLDSLGNLYVSDNGNNRIQMRTPGGIWSSAASFAVYNMTTDSLGNLYTAGYGSVQMRTPGGSWSTLASGGNGLGQVTYPYGVAVDSSGNLYIADYGNSRIEMKNSGGVWSVFSTSGSTLGQVINPFGIIFDSSGNLYVADGGNNRIQKFSATNSLAYLGAQPGHRYIQYQATLSTTDTSKTPTLDDLSLNFTYYPTTLKKLISSPFNSADKYTSVSNMVWTATNDNPATQGTAQFQLRTAPDNGSGAPDWANGSGWCGASDCNSDKSDSAFATSYYATKVGSVPQASQSDHASNQWIQYAMFLKSFDGTATPLVSNVTTNFAFNNPPAMTLPTASQLASGANDGKIQTDYVMNETATEQTSAYSLLFYQPDNITLQSDTTFAGTESIILTTPANVPVPTSGTILIGNELIAYTGKSVDSPTQTTLTGISRGQDFVSGDNYKTESAVHLAGTSVFFKAASPTGQIASSLATNTSTKTALWDPKLDANLDGIKWNNFKIAVAGNDDDLYGDRVGVAISNAFTVDLEKPTITSITSTTPSGQYKSGATILVDVNFSEPITFDSTGGKTITLTLNSQNNLAQNVTCTIAQTITNSNKATCAYNVGGTDNTVAGQYLTVNAIVTNGVINDQYANALSVFTFPTNLDASSQLIIDTTAPQVTGVAPTDSSFVNDVSGNGSSKISYTLADQNAPLSNSSKIVLTRTGGSVDANSPHTCTLQGAALTAGVHSNFRLIQGADNCQEAQMALVTGVIYSMDITATDNAGVSNVRTFTISDNSSNQPTSSVLGGWATSGTYGQFTSNTEQNGTTGSGASVQLTAANASFPYVSSITSSFSMPRSVAVDSSGNIYVADTNNNKIKKFSSAGTYLTQWGSSGSADGQFTGPWGIAIDPSGNVYVADTYNHRIQKFTSSGVFVTKWGGYGAGDGSLNSPAGIYIDSVSNVYVADTYNHRIQKFTSSGVFVMKWGTVGTNNGQFNYPHGIASDSHGNMYVSDESNRVQKFDSSGAFISLLGSYGSGNGQFSMPYAIAVDSLNNVYVADTSNKRIQKFSSSGVYLAQWGSAGSGNDQFGSPSGIAIDSSGNLFIADSANARIQKFQQLINYQTSGAYTSYVDGGAGNSTWSSFSYSGTFPNSATTIAFKIVGTNSTSTPSAGTFSGASCSISAANASGNYTFSGACATALAGQRYLWYQAILASTDSTKTPALDDASVSTATFIPGGNSTDATVAGITFDSVPPSVSIVVPDAASDGKTYFNQDQTKLSITHDENLRDNTGQSGDSEKNYIKFTNSADSNDVQTCYLSGTALTQSPRDLDLQNDCTGGVTLASNTNYDVDFHAVDLAGNQTDATQKTNVVFDTTAPILTEFQTSSLASDPATNTNIYTVTNNQINIRAKYSEALADGSNVWVILDNTTATPTYVHLDQKVAGDNTMLEGTYTVLGPQLGHDADPLNIKSVASGSGHQESVTDLAGNTQDNSNTQIATINSQSKNLGNYRRLVVYTTPPILDKFIASTGAFKKGDSITLTAKYKAKVATGSTISVRLNSGRTIELSDLAGNDTISKTFTLDDSDTNTDKLQVEEITAQNAIDTIGNVLSDTGTFDSYNVNHPTNQIQNIENDSIYTQIDYDAPTLGSTPITIKNTNGKTSSTTPQITLSASDNLNLSKAVFSLDGTSWCTPIDYNSTISTFDITSSACGGNSTNETKTVTVKFRDAAGNDSVLASAQVDFDNSKPILNTFTTDTATGTYGPNTSIKITATYNENISAGTMVINLNNGKQITLDTIENNNQLSGTYTVGATGYAEDIDKLRVGSIVSQSVSDTSDPANIQDSTSLAGITENLDSNKAIVIDTTAPNLGTNNSGLKLDRASQQNKVNVIINPSDGNVAKDGMTAQIKLLDTDTACDFTNAANETFSSFPQTFTYDDASGEVKKVCVKLTDKAGNISGAYSTVTPETPHGLQIDDISNNELSPAFYGAMLTWQKPAQQGEGGMFGVYDVLKCESPDSSDCVPDASAPITIDNIEQPYYVDTSLTLDKTYCYQVRFNDAHGNVAKLPEVVCFQAGHAPVTNDSKVSIISGNPDDIQITDVTDTGATVIYQTRDSKYNRPIATKGKIDIYTDPTLKDDSLVGTTPEESDFTVIHTTKISGLKSGIQYYLKITAEDSSNQGNTGRIGILAYDPAGIPQLTFTTLGVLTKITNVTDPPAVLTDTRAVINFSTDQSAKCLIQYGTNSVLNSNTVDAYKEVPIGESDSAAYTNNHSLTLTGLQNTAYYYEITCFDKGKSHIIYSDEYHFTTLSKGLTQGEADAQSDKTAPTISSVSLADLTGESATITWNTNEKANSYVAYNTENSDFSNMDGDALVNLDSEKYATSHTVTIKNLIPTTKYLFSVVSYDVAGNIAQSEQSSFTTKAPSSLSAVKVISVALGQATVTWTTGSATTSVVEYGLTTSYGQTKQDSSQTKDHSVLLSDLTPGQLYHFRVTGEDSAKNVFASSDMTFQPKAPPKISDFKIDLISEHGATATFTTNVPTDAMITFTDIKNVDNSGVQGNPGIATKHEIKLSNLASGSEFSVKVKVRDEDGNETEETFSDFTTIRDDVPPVLNRIRTDAALTQNDKVQTIISWTTDELANGAIIYKEGKGGDEKTLNVSDTPAYSHTGVITSFKPGTVYYFKVESTDVAGNVAISSDYALLTPKQQQNIIQVIIGNFTDIFGWAKF